MKSEGRCDFSEWEDSVLFDADDPDFCGPIDGSRVNPATRITTHNGIVKSSSIQVLNSLLFNVPSGMSVAGMQGPTLTELRPPLTRTSISVSSSLSDLVGSPFDTSAENVLTIEDLRSQMGSCFTCGVNWTEEHVSLDCTECGGYSLERPCLLCDGNCGVLWKRDFTMSHAAGKAKWQGVCPSYALSHNIHGSTTILSQAAPQTCGTTQFLTQELCARLEKLSSKAQT